MHLLYSIAFFLRYAHVSLFHSGAQGIVWYLLWLYFGYEEPSDHPNITKAELELIGKHWNTKVCTVRRVDLFII